MVVALAQELLRRKRWSGRICLTTVQPMTTTEQRQTVVDPRISAGTPPNAYIPTTPILAGGNRQIPAGEKDMQRGRTPLGQVTAIEPVWPETTDNPMGRRKLPRPLAPVEELADRASYFMIRTVLS